MIAVVILVSLAILATITVVVRAVVITTRNNDCIESHTPKDKTNEPQCVSDAEFYCKTDEEKEMFYEIFFAVCKRHNVSWVSASKDEKNIIEEETRKIYLMEQEKDS